MTGVDDTETENFSSAVKRESSERRDTNEEQDKKRVELGRQKEDDKW